jgi:hypothetical protein
MIQVKNNSGQWVPAIPLPFYRRCGYRCECGKVFHIEANYRGHYALVHILGLS